MTEATTTTKRPQTSCREWPIFTGALLGPIGVSLTAWLDFATATIVVWIVFTLWQVAMLLLRVFDIRAETRRSP